MTAIATPSRVAEYVERVAAIAPIVREHADRAERESRPADEVVEAMHEAGLFGLLLPPALRGGGLSPWEIAPVIEAMARVEGSAGWTLALGQGLLTRTMSAEALQRTLGGGRALMAGSLSAVHCRANVVDGGYTFSGRGTYVSNCTHATHLMVAALVADDGKPRFVDGAPVVVAGLFPMAQATILDTWQMAGMRGTGSHDVEFSDVFVPDEMTMPLGDALANLGGSLAPVSMGIAQHAIDAFVELASVKVPGASRSLLRERVTAQDQLGRAVALLQAARSTYYEAAGRELRRLDDGAPLTPEEQVHRRVGSLMAVQLSADAVNLVFEAAGMTGAAQSCAIERCWRDANVIRHHITVASTRYEVLGRVTLGMDPGSPLV